MDAKTTDRFEQGVPFQQRHSQTPGDMFLEWWVACNSPEVAAYRVIGSKESYKVLDESREQVLGAIYHMASRGRLAFALGAESVQLIALDPTDEDSIHPIRRLEFRIPKQA